MVETCLIAGGGVIGLMCARELQAAGFPVTIIERGETGRESSWAAGGILSPLVPWQVPYSIHDLALWSAVHYKDLADELLLESGIDPEWRRCGMLIWDTEEKAAARRWAQRKNVDLQLITTKQFIRKESRLARMADYALWLPEIAQIRPPRLMKALKKSLERRGVQIREHLAVESMVVENGRVTGLRTSQETMGADIFVLAGGAWTSQLLHPLGWNPAIEPVRGQMILYRADPDWLTCMVQYRRRYLIPRRDGSILSGSTVEPVGFDKSTTPEALQSLRQSAEELLPALRECPIEHQWAGLRPGKEDSIPWIGAHPSLPNLFINAGHFRNGVILAPASARLLTDLILHRSPIVNPDPFCPPMEFQ